MTRAHSYFIIFYTRWKIETTKLIEKLKSQLLVVLTFNPWPGKTEAESKLWVQGQPSTHSKFHYWFGYKPKGISKRKPYLDTISWTDNLGNFHKQKKKIDRENPGRAVAPPIIVNSPFYRIQESSLLFLNWFLLSHPYNMPVWLSTSPVLL